jgi:outer membrane protein W
MIRRISSLALSIAITFGAGSAFAQDEGGEAAPAGGGEPAPAGGEAKPAGGGAAAAASTESPPDAGGKIKIGLRLGYAIPLGDTSKDNKLSDLAAGMIPIWLDLGYMVTPNIMVGLYAQYGIVMLSSKIKDGCDAANASCSASDIRFGIQGQYHISPGQSLDPWVGLGIGYEMLKYKSALSLGVGAPQEVSITAKGLEFANIQGGADFKVANSFTVGPFVSFSLGQFSSTSGDVSGDIKDKGIHEWLTLGVKGTFGL